MTITFGGLATGLDTNAIIDGLMQVERLPLARLESDKIWLNSRLAAFKEFDGALNTFLTGVESLSDRDQYFQKTASYSSEDFFSATISEGALGNSQYNIEVQSLALVQKSHVDSSFSSDTATIFSEGDISITVDGEVHTISITAENASLEGITTAINEAEIGVAAGIVNDGSETDPYRLTLTGTDVAKSFTIDASDITGTESLGTITNYQDASTASIEVDGITITSTSNTITDAIQGVTLNLLKSEVGTTTSLSIEDDNSAVSNSIGTFIKGYNEVVSFITGQSTLGESDAGVLSGDSGLNAIKRNLQDRLTTINDNSGSFKALAQLGLETQKDGTLVLDSETLNSAIESDLEGVISLLAGDEDGSEGIAKQFENYLTSLTDSTQGIYAGRQQSITSNLNRIDDNIALMEMRLEKREETLRSQFNSMELLVSSLNAQGDYLSQQLQSISQLGNKS